MFGLILPEYRADYITGLFTGQLWSLGLPDLVRAAIDDMEVTVLSRKSHSSVPGAACVPVWLPGTVSSGCRKISKCEKGLLNKTNAAGELLRAEVCTL